MTFKTADLLFKYNDKKSFDEKLEEQIKPLLEENNTLKTENQNLKTEHSEYKTFFDKVKKYYGDRFSDFLEKIKTKTTIKPK
ncbi:DNA replication initiation control protein YabA [Escherichia coli]|nr:DNA replication initiation control protein YabA [Escherichia coli]